MVMNRSHFKNSFTCEFIDITWIITETVSRTNNPPIIANTISCLTIIAIATNDPPKDEPVSPIKIFAGGALYQRNPKQAPTIEPQKIEVHQHQVYIEFEGIQKKSYFQLHKKLK